MARARRRTGAVVIGCPSCGGALGAYINLRRYYSSDALSLLSATSEPEVMYEGWGEQVDDEVDYLACESCGEHFKPDVLLAAAKVKADLSLRPRAGESPTDVIDRVTRAAQHEPKG
jgi:hypothetical protein